MKKLMTMRAALENPAIFGKVFTGASWAKWRVLLIAAMGEEMTDDERVIFKALTGREREPLKPCAELWVIVGRRGGKTRAIAVLVAYIAALTDFADVLAPGERATLPILSASLWQAGKAFQYLDGIFANVAALKKLVTGQTSDTISLSTRVDIECRPASFRTIRSGTAIAIVGDEVSFWRSDDSANPDTEILNAGRPSLATTHGPLIVISSPYAKKGEVYETYKRDFGQKGDPAVIVAKASSREMNSTLDEDLVARAYKRDEASALSEYGGEFRNDLESFVSREVVEACVIPDRIELPPQPGKSYFGFVDAAGGSGQDSMTMAVAYRKDDTAVLACVREKRPPFSPDATAKEFSETLKAYGIRRVTADRWGSEFVVEAFAKHSVTCEQSAVPKSDIYKELLPMLNSGRIELLENERLKNQLCNLERRVARGGKDSIDHPVNQHDDVINAAAGALVAAGAGGNWLEVWTKLAG